MRSVMLPKLPKFSHCYVAVDLLYDDTGKTCQRVCALRCDQSVLDGWVKRTRVSVDDDEKWLWSIVIVAGALARGASGSLATRSLFAKLTLGLELSYSFRYTMTSQRLRDTTGVRRLSRKMAVAGDALREAWIGLTGL